MRRWLHALAPVGAGASVLDLGCGSGQDLKQLARYTPQIERLVGIDISQTAIDRAVAEFQGDPRAEFVCGDLSKHLPFHDHTFDLAYSVNTLECIPDKESFLRECARVLKPQGQIVMAHFDWDTQTFDGADESVVRKVVHAFNDWKQDWMAAIDPWAGRRLWKYLQSTGLYSGQVFAYTLTNTEFSPGNYGYEQAISFEALVRRGMISAGEYGCFRESLELQSEAGQYFYSITMFAYVGTRK
jgi:ubiquinone/menaquinone biosynthesis C-methylase UbiE